MAQHRSAGEMNGKVALVTGAASGIGKAVASQFAREGAELLLLDRDPMVKEVAAHLSDSSPARTYLIDLADPTQIAALTVEIRASHPRIDVLVNNAGINPKKDGRKAEIPEITDEVWAQVLAINLTAPFLLYRELIEPLKASGAGRVINITSRGGRSVSPLAAAHYAATKTGLIGLTRVMALEGAPFGITANSVAPGPILTALTSQSSEASRSQLAKSVPLGRYGDPEDVAEIVTFLASARASYVTGAVFDVNGGSFMP